MQQQRPQPGRGDAARAGVPGPGEGQRTLDVADAGEQVAGRAEHVSGQRPVTGTPAARSASR
ncbi:hypothetical protein MRQ36_04260 [Micromonospora sp. R77]|uniref:hypothetical protein n=1 Tax=Micromonospora sp. R77 TaxID=2925836 RepID=UPI001F61338F|nr:hypothetical protein [Micromonospora sp. R77]MCI4061821.1 hypothetical protein [Micromonospora sp. R77]